MNDQQPATDTGEQPPLPAASGEQQAMPAIQPMQRHRSPIVAALFTGLVAAFLAAWALALPWHTQIDVGGLFDSPYLRNFHRAEYSTEQWVSFRWSLPDAALVLPGAGRVAPLELRVHGDGQPVELDAGAGAFTAELRPGWQHIALLPRPDAWSGDIRVTLHVPEQVSAQDERPRGLVLDTITLSSHGGAPPPGQVCLIGLSAVLAVLLAAWAARRLWVGVLAGAALAFGCAVVLAVNQGTWRLLLTDYTGRLVLVLALGGVVAVGIERLLRWLQARRVLALDAALSNQTRRLLAAVALLTFLLRFGGTAYPLNHNSDLPYILGRTWLVREGKLLSIFLPNLSLTPVQWELDVTIPRSPFYYILTVPVTFLPGYQGDELGMMAFSSAVDALAVVLVALLVLAAGGSGRAAVMGAFLAGMLPFGLIVMVSWGIFPTLLGHCLSLLAALVWLHLRPRLHQRRALLLLAGSMALAFLSYPTALVFLGTTWAVLLALLALRRDRATLPTLWAGLLALGVVFVLYYGWHIPAMVSTTLPTFVGETLGTGESAASAITVTWSRTWDALWLQLADKYGGLLLALAGGGGLLLLNRASKRAGYAHLLLLAWGVAYIPFALIDEYVVTLILKQLVHILPLLAILGGLLLGKLSRRRRGLLVAGVLLALVFWQGLLTEIDHIVHGFAQLK